MTSNLHSKDPKSHPFVVGVIPARYGSTRFPGKPLALILGKSLIQRTYENAKRCSKLDHLLVATDDKRMYTHVLDFGGEVVMTSSHCPTGTDRIVEALQNDSKIESQKASIIVNIQGDEPCLDPETIEKVIDILIHDESAVMATAVAKIEEVSDALNPAIVKCVIDSKQNALYFSRALIPFGKQGVMLPSHTYYRHIGIYAFRRDFLLHYAQLPQTPLQVAEDLEQLKVLEHGFRIKVAIVEKPSIGVDFPEDIKKVEEFLCR